MDTSDPVYGSGGVFVRACQYLYDGESILFGRKGTIDRPLYVNEKFWTVDTMYYAIPQKDTCGKYIYYLATLLPFNKFQTSTALPSMTQTILGDMVVVRPSLLLQQKIADYLDEKCGEIDSLISLQEQMIAQLTDYKQSVITEAVTKGINPNAQLVPSGIDWIGDMPEYWKNTKIKKIATTNSGSTPRAISEGDNSKIVWIRTTDIDENVVYDSSVHLTFEEFTSASCPMLKEGTCVVAMYGGGGTIGKSGILGTKATINQALCSMEVNDTYFEKYLFYVLRAVRSYWMKYAVGTRKDPNINQEIVKNMTIPYPTMAEQHVIADYLDNKCAEIDALIALKQRKIETLKDYKKSLIYEAVTGKMEI